MFKNIYPLFERKRILKKEMLENLRDYPRNLFEIMYEDYADGILAGCRIEARREELVILPGILYHHHIPYFLEEACHVPYQSTGTVQYLKVHFADKTSGAGQEEYLSQIVLDERKPEESCEMELARFKLQEGARLRVEYVDFFDYSTEFDTVHIIHRPYASPGKSSIAPEIVKAFAKALMGYPVQSPWDYVFCMDALRERTLPYEEISAYLNVRGKAQKACYQNWEIDESLKQILLESSGKEQAGRQMERKEKKLLLM